MAIEAEALRDALRLALRIVDRAAGEGLMFLASKQRMPAVEAADICHAVADALGIVPGGDEYMALIGDGPLPALIRSALAEDTARAAEGMRERAAKVCDDRAQLCESAARQWMEGEHPEPEIASSIMAGADQCEQAASEIRALPLDKEAGRSSASQSASETDARDMRHVALGHAPWLTEDDAP